MKTVLFSAGLRSHCEGEGGTLTSCNIVTFVLHNCQPVDPIVPFATIDVASSSAALEKCIVMKRGGHCTVPDEVVDAIRAHAFK